MTTGAALVLFAVVMGVAAMLAIGVDWIGKPFRNRKFRPRIYRYPDEQGARVLVDPTATGHSAEAFQLPAAVPHELPTYLSTGGTDWGQAAFEAPPTATDTWELLGRELDGSSASPAETGFGFLDEVEGFDQAEPEPAPVSAANSFGETAFGGAALGDTTFADDELDLNLRPSADSATSPPEPTPIGDSIGDRGEELRLWRSHITFQRIVEGVSAMPPLPGEWHAGDPIWAPDEGGTPPPPQVAEQRFWKSTAAFMPGTQWYGRENTDRIISGQAPQRRNRRNGQLETMQIDGLDSDDDTRPIRPFWPDQHVDPFQAGLT